MSSIRSHRPRGTEPPRWTTALLRVAVGALVLCFTLLPRSARAQPKDQEPVGITAAPASTSESEAAGAARALHDAALARYSAGDYVGAVEHFSAAYALYPASGFLYNIAQAERLAGHCENAVEKYRAFLGTEPRGKIRDYAATWLEELEPCATPNTATPNIAAPNTAVPSTAVPSSAAAVTRPPVGRAGTPRETERPRATPPATSALDGRAEPHGPGPSGGRTLRAVIAFGAAIALFSASAYFAVSSARASDRVSDAFARGGSWNEVDRAHERAGRRDQTFAIAGAAGGVLASGVGVWFLTFD